MQLHELKPKFPHHLLPVDEEGWKEVMDGWLPGQSLEERWNDRTHRLFRLSDPNSKCQPVMGIGSSLIAFSRKISDGKLGTILGYCGEWLPAKEVDSGEEYFVLNVKVLYNCLNRKKTIFQGEGGSEVTGTDQGLGIINYALFTAVIRSASVFHIPQEREKLFAITGNPNVHKTEELFTQFRKSKWKDYLSFEEVWNDEG